MDNERRKLGITSTIQYNAHSARPSHTDRHSCHHHLNSNITASHSEHKISESQARPDHVTKSPPGGRLSRYFKTLPGDFSASSLGGCSSTKLLQMFAIKFSELFILIVNYFLSLKLLHWLIKHQQSCSKYFSQRNQFYLVHQKFVYREKALS